MIGRTTRVATLGAGALLALGCFSAPAFASDGVQTEATVQTDSAAIVNQTLDLVNRACVDATTATRAATSTLASGSGITVASQGAGSDLQLAVSLPALTRSLPVLGSVAGQLDAAPLKISCSTSGDGAGLGVSAAGVDALVNAIAPGVDVSSLLAGAGLTASTSASATDPATSADAAAPAGTAAASGRLSAQSPTVRAGASAPPRTAAATTATTGPASASTGIIAQTVGSPGALARTGAGVSALGLLGMALVGSGRFLTLARKLLRHAG